MIKLEKKYDLVVVGTSFSASFFLQQYLRKAPGSARILVLEWGERHNHDWRINNNKFSTINAGQWLNSSGHKWITNITFGGNSNCWWACTPRMLPADFKLKSTYGVGYDWPISYDDLERYYVEAERTMGISGPEDPVYPMSQGYPLPPHKFNKTDEILASAFPGMYLPQATARPSNNDTGRPRCCSTARCHLCPIDSKFTIINSMQHIYSDSRITLMTGCRVTRLETSSNSTAKVFYNSNNVEEEVEAESIALGANALFNAHILQNSNIEHPLLGKRLNEQVSFSVDIDLKGLDNFQGSTSVTGHGFMYYDGPHRKEHAACLIENYNFSNKLRPEINRWTQTMRLKFVFEDIPQDQNYVRPNPNNSQIVDAIYLGHSDYTDKGMAKLKNTGLPQILNHLPVEDYSISEIKSTEAHILGTTVMGNTITESVVDKYCRLHKHQNIFVLGGSVFPSTAPANPSLTISALSLFAADHGF